MRKKQKTAALTVLLALCLLAAGCAPKNAVRQDGAAGTSLTICSQLPYYESKIFFDAFTQATGIEVNAVYQKGLTQEKQASPSVCLGASALDLMQMEKDGKLLAYASPALEQIPEKYRPDGAAWTPYTIGIVCFAANWSWQNSTKTHMPESWKDFLASQYENEIAFAHPRYSDASYMVLVSLVQSMGESDALFYFQRLNRNLQGYTDREGKSVTEAGTGAKKIALCYANESLKAQNDGYQLIMSYPEDGAIWLPYGAAILKGAPREELENAKRFIDWLIGKDAQQLLKKPNISKTPLHQELSDYGKMQVADSLTKDTMDLEFAFSSREYLLARYEEKVSKYETAQEVAARRT